jgi:hypothetical protein
MLSDPQSIIADFIRVAAISGIPLHPNEVAHETLLAGHHNPVLPSDRQAVYVFSLSAEPIITLKVGKVGPNSNARFQFQHYNPHSAGSNLAKSVVKRRDLWPRLGIRDLALEHVGQWIRDHTDRDHFFISAHREAALPSLLEVFLQCRLRPLYEG